MFMNFGITMFTYRQCLAPFLNHYSVPLSVEGYPFEFTNLIHYGLDIGCSTQFTFVFHKSLCESRKRKYKCIW